MNLIYIYISYFILNNYYINYFAIHGDLVKLKLG